MEFVKRNLTLVTTMIVVLCITAGIVVPFTAGGSHTETTTETVNEGGSWLKLAYGAPAGEIAITLADNVLTVGDQSGSDDDLVIAAWENGGIFTSDGSLYVLTENNGSTALVEASEATIAPAEGGITVTVGADTYTVTSTDLLMPSKTGDYATFDFTDPINKVDDKDVVAFGTFAGAYGFGSDAYVDGYGGLGLVPDVTIVDGAITAVKWVMPAGDAKAVKEIKDPIEVIEEKEKIEPEPDAGTKAIPTDAQYTDGDFGFDVISDTNNAAIVSYWGSYTGTITFPSEVSDGVNSYTVTEIGRGGNSQYVIKIPTGSHPSIVLPDTLKKINDYAFLNTSDLAGQIIIPVGVMYIGTSAFMNCGASDCLVIPTSITSIGMSAFTSSKIPTIVNLSDATYTNYQFQTMNYLTEFLNLGNTELSSTCGISDLSIIKNELAATMIVGQTVIEHEPSGGSGLPIVAAAIPAVIIIAMLVLGIRMWVGRND